MIYYYDEKKCLNGWWDIKFNDAWNEGKYLVPSVWNKSGRAVRKEGEKYFDDISKDLSKTNDYLFDAFGYPYEWNEFNDAEVRRKLLIYKQDGKRYFLVFEGVAPNFELFINGSYVGSQMDPCLPYIPDITDYIIEGENEILLKISNYVKVDDKKSIWPCGNEMLYDFRGIWQDVYLLERESVYLEDVTIKTSVRKKEITFTYVINNTTQNAIECIIKSYIDGEQILKLPEQSILANVGTTEITFSHAWENPELWSPENPKLYLLKIQIGNETYTERFGFREVWLDGYNFILNGYPIHLFSDWGHKMSQFNHTKAWVQKWFDMIKDGNMNHSRLHTHPHPRFIMDMADELGIFITGEAALHGSGGCQAGDSEEFWQNAATHITNFVKRDKNHPCVILWSVENEMRWNRDNTDLPKKQLPLMRQLFNKLDDTRIAYHEGDTSWWNEKEQTVLSRHYGKECTGLGWWDKTKPLHSGELASYHYAGPNNTMHIFGDKVWEDYRYIDRAAATDFALTVEDARANDVICLGPWNMSCLSNLRPSKEFVKLTYEDYSCPGVKPLQVMPGASEFEFWKDGKGYYPQESFSIQAHAFRPFTIIDTNRQNQYFVGNTVKRTLNIINDTVKVQQGTLTIRFANKTQSETIYLKRGENFKFSFEFILCDAGKWDYCVDFNGKEQIRRTFKIATKQKIKSTKKIGVLGKHRIGAIFDNVDFIDKISAAYEIIVIEKNTVTEGSRFNLDVRSYLRDGGRVLLMEQETSLFPGIKLKTKPVLKAFIRDSASPVLKGINEEYLEFWGATQFTLLSGDSYVTEFMYEKGVGDYAFPIIDSGEGGFGYGDMDNTALFEAIEGDGLILACQLRISDKFESIPIARKLLQNMVTYLETHKHENKNVLCTNNLHKALEFDGSVLLEATDEVLSHFNLQKVVEQDGIWQGIKKQDISFLSNEDICGIENFTYSPAGLQDYKVADYAFCGNAEAVIVTPTKSALKELFVYKGFREPLRAYTITNYCYNSQSKENMLVGKIDNIYISSFNAKGNRRFERLKNYLLKNLGGISEISLLEGNIEANGESKGYPEHVYACTQKVADDIFEQMLESTTYQIERMNPTAILDIAPFQSVFCKDGFINASENLNTYIFYTIESNTVRKDLGSNLGVPNPDALTFLELTGRGKVEIWINSKPIAEFYLDGEATISDLELERGYNHVVIQWKATQNSDVLKTYWRNISRKAETGFKFLAKAYSGN
jgi:beta-galactosidase